MSDEENPPPPPSHHTCSLPHCEEPADRGCCTGSTPHYLCDVCFCGYAASQCTAVGAFEHERVSADDIVSAPGELPCYLFLTNQCDCARIPNTTLARVLSTDPIALDSYEAAKRRLIQAQQNEEEAAVEAAQEQHEQESTPVERLHKVVVEVLSRGGHVACPTCHQHRQKDDACMHMICPCGTRFCYCCGRQRGDGPSRCPSSGNGCDSTNPYLEHHQGWGNFSLNEEESSGLGALHEFHRRRAAYFLRQVKENYPTELWDELRQTYPDRLENTPTDGRRIEWDEIDTAEPPLFGHTTVNELEWKDDGTLACVEVVQEEEQRETHQVPPKRLISCDDHTNLVAFWIIGLILAIIMLSFGAKYDNSGLQRTGGILIAILAGTGLPVAAMRTVDLFAANPQYGCIREVQCLRGRNNGLPYLATQGRWSNHRKLYWYCFFCGIAFASVCLTSKNMPFLRALGIFLLTLILVSYSGVTLIVNAEEAPNSLDFQHFVARLFVHTVMFSIGVGILAVYKDSYNGNIAGKVFFALGFAGIIAEVFPRLHQDRPFTRAPDDRRLVLSYVFCIELAVGSLLVGLVDFGPAYIVGIVLIVTALVIALPLYLNENAAR